TSAVVPPGKFNSPPYTTPQEPYFLPPPLNFAYAIDAHAWPYKWYLQTVRFALAGPTLYPNGGCSGFTLSPEFLESNHPILLVDRDRIVAAKSGLRVGQDIAIVGNQCGTDSPRSYLPTHNFFTDLLLINVGNTEPILDVLQNQVGVRFATQ